MVFVLESFLLKAMMDQKNVCIPEHVRFNDMYEMGDYYPKADAHEAEIAKCLLCRT